MSQNILNVAADFSQALNAQVSVGDTTAALDSAADTDGNNLATGYWGFTIDGDNQYKEYIVCTLTGTALTGIVSITPQGVATTGFKNYHRRGASVVITDWAALYRVVSVLNGTLNLDGGIPLAYDSTPALGSSNQLATVQYVLDHINGGAVSFNAEIVAGMAGETLTTGQWVYLKSADGRWYKTDATNTAKCIGVKVGKALGAGTAGNAISGGVFIDGLETTGTYAAFTTYYLSDTPGALATSAGTNSVVVGFADGNAKLLVGNVFLSYVDALAGGSTFGTPSSTNKYLTQSYNSSATGLPVVRTYLNAGSPAVWSKPAGLKYVVVEVQAAGGGSGGTTSAGQSTAGGGGGGYSRKLIAVATLGATETVTTGAGGTAGAATGGTGGTGGSSSFGAHATATGGGGGTEAATGGDGGIGSSGDTNIKGQAGADPSTAPGTKIAGGLGGSAVLGGGGSPAIGAAASTNGSGNTGGVYGGGGGGSYSGSGSDTAGAVGGAGIVIVTEYYS